MSDFDNIKIEKGVPLPPLMAHRKSALKKAIEAMKPGDSFWVKLAKSNPLHAAKVGTPGTFVARREGDGFRFWRTS